MNFGVAFATKSDMKLSLSLMLTFVIVLTSACSNSKQELASEESASFMVSPITANAQLVSHATIAAVKEANFIQLKACLKDGAVLNSIVGVEFDVSMQDFSAKLRTDGDGCLNWSYPIVFSWFETEGWVKRDITIAANSLHLGSKTITTYINPWQEGAKALIDSRYQQPVGLVKQDLEVKSLEMEHSPLTLTNIKWNVDRRKQRGDQTVFEWRFEATPVIERQDIAGQVKREVLQSGQGHLNINIAGESLDSERTLFAPFSKDVLSWQGGVLKGQGEMIIKTVDLPKFGDQIQLMISFDLPGELPSTQGLLQLSSIESGSGAELIKDIEKVEQASIPDDVQDTIGTINISETKVTIDTDDLEGYYLDENLQLSLTKAFRVEFSPKVILPGADIMGSSPTTLTHGQLEVKVHLFSPTKAGLDFENPDLSKFTHIASDEMVVDIRPDGRVSKVFKFPIAIMRASLLRLKTLIIIEATPIGNISSVAPEAFASEIYPLASGNNVTAFSQDKNTQIHFDLKALDRGDKRGLFPRSGDGRQALRTSLKQFASENEHEFSEVSLSQISAIRVDAKVAKIAEADNSGFNHADFRVLMSSRALPKATLRKLCNVFFEAPVSRREYSWGQFSTTLQGGEDWQACLKDPQSFIRTAPSDHVEEFLKTQKIGDTTVTKPRFVSQARGDIFRGVGFFAAFGDRSGEGEGVRDSSSIETHLGFELTIPFIASVGVGGDRAHTTYVAKDKASMQSSFERQYTQQKDIELEYNRITLEFLAKMRRCLSASAERSKKTMLICEDNDRLAKVQESWYFIGDTRLNKVGVITNSNLPGDDGMAQVVRGEASFKKVWGEFRNEDRALILEKLDEPAQGILHKPLTEQLVSKDNYIGVGFPGVIVPY